MSTQDGLVNRGYAIVYIKVSGVREYSTMNSKYALTELADARLIEDAIARAHSDNREPLFRFRDTETGDVSSVLITRDTHLAVRYQEKNGIDYEFNKSACSDTIVDIDSWDSTVNIEYGLGGRKNPAQVSESPAGPAESLPF